MQNEHLTQERAWKIIVIDSRRHGVADIALPFETDTEIVDAWDWVVGNCWLPEFSYRPQVEGDDPNRAFIEVYLADTGRSFGLFLVNRRSRAVCVVWPWIKLGLFLP